ncbi:hypothetical protein [Nitrobacter vulgaris]|uniref:Uncharacterized protein n=1 Tax=Nitrobacter vulgaris TaxID=29421 RepID=A0A1V4HWU9_NITVU|nr:hypothetical protein [Nitrobacter vulgaris]OPH82441.1 hypothetical protein B2M20_11620 [Nitrobacter vulgaris]
MRNAFPWIKGLVRFVFFTGSFGLDAFLLAGGAISIFSMFNPRPSFIYDGPNSLSASLVAFYYPVVLWGLFGVLFVLSVGMAIRGFKAGAAQAKTVIYTREGGVVDFPWWTCLGMWEYWDQVVSWTVKGLFFGFLAYQGMLHEYAARPWFPSH